MKATVINFVGFEVCWFACILSAAYSLPVLGVSLAASWIVVHLYQHREFLESELSVVGVAVVVGFGLDSLLFQLRLLESPYERFWALGPLWLMALWMSFATTVRHSLGWLTGRPVLQVLLGLVGGPLAYLGGESLGALTVNGLWGTVGVMVVYSVTVPALFITASVAAAKGSAIREAT